MGRTPSCARDPLVALLLFLALSSCQPKQSASLHVSPSLEALVPADTVVVLGVNLAAIRDTTIYQKLISRVPLPQLDHFTQQTGLDPRKDLSEILTCSNGKNAQLLVRGKFRVADLEARFKSNGVTPSNYKGHSIFGDDRASITFLDDSTAAAGTTAEIRALLDQPSGAGRGLPAPLRDLLRTLPANDQVYAALTGGVENLNLPLPREGNLGNIMQALRSVQSATLGMDLSQGIDAIAVVNCNTERDAKFVHDMVRGLVGFGRLNTPDNQPDLLKLYDGIQVTAAAGADQSDRRCPPAIGGQVPRLMAEEIARMLELSSPRQHWRIVVRFPGYSIWIFFCLLAGTLHAAGPIYSAILSGAGQEYATAVTSDAQGNVYVARQKVSDSTR